MHKKISDLEKFDRPREKLERYGPNKLRDEELLAIVLGSGTRGVNVLELSKLALKAIRAAPGDVLLATDLLAVKGLGKAKVAQILAILALSKRLPAENERPEILSAKEVWNHCIDFRSSQREHFVAFYLDTRNRLIERQLISMGTLDASLVHPREVFEPAIQKHASSIIVAHNHPSGNLEPSAEDKEITKRLREAGKVIGIEILDHIILSRNEFLSLQK